MTDRLVPSIPSGEAEREALWDRVRARDLVRGQLVSEDGKAVLLYGFAAYGAEPRAFAERIRQVVESSFPGRKIYYGGAAFVSTYIYSATQEDLRRLTPWAVLVIVLLVVLSFRDAIGAGLALLSTGMGIAISMGLMGFLGVRYNIVLSSMPVILFAVGSAYAIHVLATYYRFALESGDRQAALLRTLQGVGPIVLASGATTVAGLLSFLAMDIEPLRTFGVFTAIGIMATAVLALTFVPAVVYLLDLPPRSAGGGALHRALVRVVVAARRRRVVTACGLLAVAAAGGWFVSRVDSRMDQRAFFAEGSPPDEADRFLGEHFGGSTFIQVHFTGDFTDPYTLRELERIADLISVLPGVSSVQHIGQIVGQVNEAFSGERRIPDTAAQVKALQTFLAGKPGVGQLVTEDRTQALLHVKLRSSVLDDVERDLEAVEAIVARELVRAWRVVPGSADAAASARMSAAVVARARALAKLSPAPAAAFEASLAEPIDGLVRTEAIASYLARFLRSDEAVVDLGPSEEPAARIAAAVAALGPGAAQEAVEAAVLGVLGPDSADAEDVAASLEQPVADAWRRERAAIRTERALRAAGVEVPAGVAYGVRHAVLGLDAPGAIVPASGEAATGRLDARVNGLPVLHRGLSRSVEKNQLRSLALALGLVVVILALLFRSVVLGLFATAPTLLTLLIVYGGMGALGIHLDIGTSMLASLVIGAGVDYAVHLVSAWRAAGPVDPLTAAAKAAESSGVPIWTNALMVAAGFFVLTLGEARALRNVGGLTSAAMIAAALATFLTIPVLAGKHRGSNES